MSGKKRSLSEVLTRKVRFKKVGPASAVERGRKPRSWYNREEIDQMAYKRMLESFSTAIYYGHSYNRYDLFEFDEDTGILTLTKLFLNPGEEVEKNLLCRYNVLTNELHGVWPENRSMKITVGEFVVEILAVFGIPNLSGDAGFLKMWEKRLKRIVEMRRFQNDYKIRKGVVK